MLAPIVKNVSGEVIPAFALMRVVNTTHNGDRLVLEVGKPNGECGAAYVVNGKINIQIDGHGSYQDASNHFVLLTDETTGMVGPIPNSWTAGIGKMYNVLGPAKDTAARASLVAIDRLSLEKFRIDEDLQSCGVAQATLLTDDCAVIKSIYVRDTTGQAYTDELMASGAMGFCRFTSEVMLDPITLELLSVYEVVSIGSGGCCGESDDSDSDDSDDSQSDDSDDSDDDSDMDCFTIPGVDFDEMEEVDVQTGDFVLVVRDGCLKLGRVGPCRTDDSE